MIQVYVNGLHFGAADYTASNGSTVVLNQARNVGDLVRIVCSQGFAASAMQAYNFTEVTASSNGQTAFAAIYNTATVQVFVDGVLRSPTAYTASNGTSITLSSGVGIVVGTKVGVISFNSISLTNAISSSGGTINGNLNVNGSLQQGGIDVKAYATAVALALGA
jgi:spore maturation protein SpmA